MVFVHLATGFEEIEALTVVDLLRRVEIEAVTVSITGERVVEGAHGIPVVADILFEEVSYENCQMMVLPGGMPGALHLADHEGLKAQILAFYQMEKPMAAICAAPMVFGKHHVLGGRQATIYPGMESHLEDGIAVDMPVVRDGNLITSQGPSTAMLFALEIVTFLRGEETAVDLKRDLLLER